MIGGGGRLCLLLLYYDRVDCFDQRKDINIGRDKKKLVSKWKKSLVIANANIRVFKCAWKHCNSDTKLRSKI